MVATKTINFNFRATNSINAIAKSFGSFTVHEINTFTVNAIIILFIKIEVQKYTYIPKPVADKLILFT